MTWSIAETRTNSQDRNTVVEIFQVVPASLYQEPPCQNELGVTSVKIEMRSSQKDDRYVFIHLKE